MREEELREVLAERARPATPRTRHPVPQVAALAVGCGMVLNGHLTAEQLTNFIMWVGRGRSPKQGRVDTIVDAEGTVQRGPTERGGLGS